MNRRKRNRRRNRIYMNNNLEKKIVSFIIVIVLSLAAGYIAAAYIIGPAIGLEIKRPVDEKESSEKKKESKSENETENDVIEDKIETGSTGYVLQYGSFSTKTAAEACSAELKRSDIETTVTEKDGAYKVISRTYDTEAEARKELEQQSQLIDVFITQIP